MPPAPTSGQYANTRASPRFAFDALVGVVVSQPDKPRQFWSRSTDLSQGGIGANLIGGEVKPDELASLQIPLPKQHPVELRASLRYRIGLHCGFAFLDLTEGQRSAVRLACDALARSQTRDPNQLSPLMPSECIETAMTDGPPKVTGMSASRRTADCGDHSPSVAEVDGPIPSV